ncbi:DUF72 domain-containing protein [Calothrix sp. UHCC 0171]|uniref:DUF72 domain-containing protein n=1 Tax=Calothrix sp. UHCC 0171 TaxID=3110245 RepID=UPI002B200A95|nr:DUF72 domain-containing protein [Calothrix sp. UHCC 0171]MEA5570552.1 DUF72 domain-containing protein [Calothrix sp. UHCC 0171]
MKFLIGCAVWSYKGWLGDFYPKGTRNADFLKLYSRRFNAVEGNTTFYAVPNTETVKKWASETPENFRFCLKLPRAITHNGILQPYIPKALEFAEQMRPLGTRLAPMFLQLPPSYSPKLIDDLGLFLEAWQQTKLPLAVEVRHRDWFQEIDAIALNKLLESFNIGRVLLDSRPIYTGDDDPQLESERRKPKLPVQFTITSNFSLIRFISHPKLEMNQQFMAEWVTQIQNWLQQNKEIYFFVHCPIEDYSPRNARHFYQNFYQKLQENGLNISPLPWDEVEQEPNQLSLW